MEINIMDLKNKSSQGKSKKSAFSVVLYVIASVVALLGIALLIVDFFIFKTAVAQYVAQGYTAAVVMRSLIPSQLLPSILQDIATYGGIAFILIGLGIVNTKISKLLPDHKNTETDDKAIEENTAADETADEAENTSTEEYQEETEDSEATKTV